MNRFFALCLSLAISIFAAKPGRFEDRGEQYRAGKKSLKILHSRTQRAVFYKHSRGIRLFDVTANPTGASLSPQAWKDFLRADSGIAFTREILFDSASQAEFIPSDRLFAKVRVLLSPEAARGLAARAGVEFVEAKSGSILGFKLLDPKADPLSAVGRLSGQPEVEWAQPEIYFRPQKFFLPDDPLFGRQWHLHNTGQQSGTPGADVKIVPAWDITRGDPSIVIAILDDGVETTHPDLRIRTGGRNYFANPYTTNPNPTLASDDHGTSVAGVAAAKGNNGLGVSGAAPNASILPVKISEGESFASNVGISDAIRYAADAGADIINNSWGGGPFDNMMNDAITYASTQGRSGKGCLVFCASGNSSSLFNGDSKKRGGSMEIVFSDTSAPPGDYSIGFRFSDAGSVPGDTDWVVVDNISLMSGDGFTVRMGESFGAGLPAGWSTSGTPWRADTNFYSGTGDRISMRSGIISAAGAFSELRMPLRTYTAGDHLRVNRILNNDKGDLQVVFYDADGFEVGRTFPNVLNESYGRFFGNRDITFPAAADSAIAVGASTEFDFRSGYSQFNEAGTGKSVDFLAPSSGAWSGITTTDRLGTDGSTDSNYTVHFGGTSSASPLAAGVAALLLSRNPNLTRVQVLAIMRATADKIGDQAYVGGRNTEYGFGRLNAYQAMLAVPLPPSPTTLKAPLEGSLQSAGLAVFTWHEAAGALTYRLQLSLVPDFAVLAFEDSMLTDSSRQVNQLAAGVKYYWRVAAQNDGGASAWTATRSFTTPTLTGSGAEWVQTPFPPGSNVAALGLLGASIFTGTSAGIFKSPDNGSTWAPATGGLSGFFVQSFTSSHDSLYIGTSNGGVGLSTDSGANWAQVGWTGTGVTNYNILSLVKKDATVLAGSGAGVFRSVNNGVTWNPAGAFTDSIFALVVKGNDFFLATAQGVFRSIDNGVTWNSANTGIANQPITALGVSGGSLLAGTLQGKVFRSSDNGANWLLKNEGWGGNAIRSFAFRDKGLFASTAGGGVYLSPDSGNVWASINRGLTDTLVQPLVVNGSQLFAGTASGGIFRYLGIPPTVSAGPDLSVDEGQVLSFAVTGSDLDGDAVALNLINPPAGSVLSSVSGIYSWVPGFTQAGTYALYFHGTSNFPVSADTDTVIVTVNNVDRPPVVVAGADRAGDEGQAIGFSVTGLDPDGDATILSLVNTPAGANFISGVFTWTPGFTQTGLYPLYFQGVSNGLVGADTLVLTINNVDRPPSLNSVSAKSVREGETLAFSLAATDPDGDAVTFAMFGAPAGAKLTGPDFTWSPGYSESGNYLVSLIARSGLLADTVKMEITVIEVGNGLGIARISGPKGAVIGFMPSGSYPGERLGVDSVAVSAKPGIHWFSLSRPGYRTSYVASNFILHQTTSMQVQLQPGIPLWFAAPKPIQVDGKTWIDTSGTALAVADLDGDGKQDIQVSKVGHTDLLRNLGASDSVPGNYSLASRLSNNGAPGLVSAAFVDWNNSGAYALLAADLSGAVFVLHRDGAAYTDSLPLKYFPGDSVRAWTMDWDGDSKKDLCLQLQGQGMYLYRNIGSDESPGFSASGAEIFQTDGSSLVSLNSMPIWLDADNDGEQDMVAFQQDTLKIWYGQVSGGNLKLLPPQVLNIGGSPFKCSQCLLAMQLGPQGLPNLLVVPRDGTGLMIASHLRGDINGDKVVDALDLGRILDGWMKKPTDANWNPRYNLQLNPTGLDTIDTGDLDLLESDWELRE